MIQVIRYEVFETNSSSSHSFSLVSLEKAKEVVEDNDEEDFEEGLSSDINCKTTVIGKLNFCESLVVCLDKKVPNFDSDAHLLRIKELLQDEKRLYSHRFACDRTKKTNKTDDYRFLEMPDDEIIENAEKLFIDLSNIDVVCYSIKNIVTDDEVAIKIDSSYFY